MEPLVLIVEDDSSLREITSLGLQREGFRVLTAADGHEALAAFSAHEPDIVLLDIMLPGRDGFEICREVRLRSLAPIIMLTARAATADVVAGLEAGADDYVTKPFEFAELVARVRSVLRRTGVAPSPRPDQQTAGLPPGGEGPLHLGPLVIDPSAHAVTRDGVDVALTVTEFRLLFEFARHAGQVLSRDQLLELVWGYSYLGDSRLVDVHVQRLRAKVETDPVKPTLIQTVRGVGYRAQREG